jgi:hypothetical protein
LLSAARHRTQHGGHRDRRHHPLRSFLPGAADFPERSAADFPEPSWDPEHTSDFWFDAIASDDADYFIGSFVTYSQSHQFAPLLLVDGQQRLTTITLILAAVRNAFDSIGAKDLATATQVMIVRPDQDGAPRHVLSSESP